LCQENQVDGAKQRVFDGDPDETVFDVVPAEFPSGIVHVWPIIQMAWPRSSLIGFVAVLDTEDVRIEERSANLDCLVNKFPAGTEFECHFTTGDDLSDGAVMS